MNDVQSWLRIINQVFEIEKKSGKNESLQLIERNMNRISEAFQDMGLRIHNPAGEPYDDQRTDYEASIAGDPSKKLFITDVLKPAVYFIENNKPSLLQKAVVIADNK